jgi:Tol biopolymer transport system component
VPRVIGMSNTFSQENIRMQFSTPSRRACVVTVMLGLALLIAAPAVAQVRTNGRIAFHSQRANFNFDIFTINPDGTGELQLTNSLANLSPDWSSAVDQIVFTSQRDGGNPEIYVMNSNGSNQTRLTTTAVPEFTPAWSPDGTKIVFVSRIDDEHLNEIFIMNADGSGRLQLTDNSASDSSPVWSPDGTRIAFTSTRDHGAGEIYVMNANGTGQTRITTNTAFDSEPYWSPAGDQLAFASTRDGNYEIYRMSADGLGTATRLTTNPAEDRNPTWSPDGTKIAFVSDRISVSNPELYVMNAADGGNQTRITTNTVIDNDPSWHPVLRSLIISEFRTFGPTGDCDEFVEIYNPSDSPLVVQAFDGSAGFAVARSNNNVLFTIPNTTPIPARGHFLAVTNGVGCGAYSGGTTPDISMNENIPMNNGIALFRTSNQANFNLANRLDAAGSSSESNTLYKENTGYPFLTPTSAGAANHSLFRDLRSGFPKDTDNNETDFIVANTAAAMLCFATPNFQCQRLGAPGPENLSSPVQRNDVIKASLVDAQCASIAVNPTLPSACRFERRTGAGSGQGASPTTFGTLSIRRRFTNNTTAPITSLRFRIVDLTTTPESTGVNGFADLRAISSTDVTATCQSEGGTPHLCSDNPSPTTTIRGTTLETDTNGQPNGGGFNSTLAAGTITTTPLQPGASVNIQFLLGVERNGRFRFFVNIEALPAPAGAPAAAAAGNSNLKSGGAKAASRGKRP